VQAAMATILESNDESLIRNGAVHDAPPALNGELHRRPSQHAARGDFWSSAAPKALRRGAGDAQTAWRLYFDKRDAAAPVARLVHAAGTPLLWGLAAESLSNATRGLLNVADELARGADASKAVRGERRTAIEDAACCWLEEAGEGDTDVNFGLGCLAAAHVIHQLGGQLDAELGWELLDFLAGTAEEARPWDVDLDGPADAALAQQLVAGELPLVMSYYFAEMGQLAAHRRPGRRRLVEGLAELTDDCGLPRAGQFNILRPLAACWTRARAIGALHKAFAWKAEVQARYQSVVRQAVRWSGAEGEALLASEPVAAWTPDFLAAAVRGGGRDADAAAARSLFRGRIAKEVPGGERKLPRLSTNSDDAALALLRSNWSRRATTVAVDYSTPTMRVEVVAAGRPMLAGQVLTSSSVDGNALTFAGAWENVCWFSDRDADYAEFVLSLSDGARLERQLLLARKDEFLLMIDHLQNSTSATLTHSWELPLSAGLEWQAEEETRDAVISRHGRPVARVMPLALPEWRLDPRMGELDCTDGALQLNQRTAARAVACPLFFDLRRKRVAKPCTWRQLTVAESLEIQPADVAVGYRVQCGKTQWAIYRSLGPRGNRTFLGINTSNEFLVARFSAPSGETETLVEVHG
jgi:antitoxin (DNA-binding transcriptional repressor) of toxin-antitoxin stability system